MESKKTVGLIRIRYTTALTLIALMVTGSYLAAHRLDSRQQILAELIDLAGQQSAQVQRVAFYTLLMITSTDAQDYAAARAQLGPDIDRLQQLHQALLLGKDEQGMPLVNHAGLQALVYDENTGLEISIKRFLEVVNAVYKSEPGTFGPSSHEYRSLGAYGPQALEPVLDAVLDEYRKMSRDALTNSERSEQQLWIATLALLLLLALFIFKPLEQRVAAAMSKLQDRIDILESTRERYVAAREKAESASEAKSQFLATMTHELRTPMNGVLGMSELLSGTRLNEQQQEYAQIIVESSESLLTIINDILDFSRLEAGKVGLEKIPFNLEQSAYDVMALLAPRCQNKNLQLILDYAPDLPRSFTGDPARIRQIFFNLIGNAIKFTRTGYIQVSITVDLDEQQLANIAIHVEDTGIGIAPNKVHQLFNSFTQADNSTTRKYGGTGLGLTITRELLTLMGGHIAVDSAPGKGSVFSLDFQLPIADQIDELPLPGSTINHVMLLEPNEVYRDLIIDRLARIEVETAVVDSASDIKSRLKSLEEHGGAEHIVIVSQEAILDSNNRWQDFGDGSLVNPVSWLILGNGDDESKRFRKLSRHLQGHTTFMQKPFTNYQLYYALKTSMRQEGNDQNLPEIDVDATDFTLSKASRGRILLVEDNLANQKFASLLLSKMGYKADIAEDGCEAIRLWREREYDLILMDCLMPNMDGYAATSSIRKEEDNNDRIPIIALTANASEKDREKCQLVGMNEVLTKPYRKQELADLLDRWLNDEPSFITIRHNLG